MLARRRPEDEPGVAAPAPRRQRRSEARVEGRGEVHLGRPGEPMVRCGSVEYSGSGLRALLPGLELAEGENVEVFVRMPDGVTVETRAVVVRSGEHGVSAFRFVGIEPGQRELLIRRVFAEQRRELASARRRG